MQPERLQDETAEEHPPPWVPDAHARVSTETTADAARRPARAAVPDDVSAAAPAEAQVLGCRETGRVVTAAVFVTAAVAAFDVALTGRLSMFFDLCFVLVGLVSVLAVRRRGLFAVAVLPPLALGAVVAVLALAHPVALTSTHLAFASTWLTGLAHHGGALVTTHVVVLVVVWVRAAQRGAGTR